MPTVPKTLAPGWRCDACDYPLEGLPDRAEHTQCPECGHTARPVGAPAVPSTAAVVLAAIVSLIAVAAAGFALFMGYAVAQADTSDAERRNGGLIMLAIAVSLLYLAVIAWGVPSGRWRVARIIGALIPAGLGATAAWALLWYGGFFSLGILTFSVMALSYLLHPEIDRWLRRPRSSARP